MFQHLLVPTDGSPLSAEAVARAVSFAREAGARITFVCVIQPFPKMYFGTGAIFDGQAPVTFREQMSALAREILTEAQLLAFEAGVACSCQTLVSEHPYEAIIQAAEDHGSDLIFMASHGRRGLKAFVLGSETQKVLTHSTIPVLVHRSQTASD